MGKGNVCVTGSCEGLYYIDNDQYHVYCRNDPYAEYPETRLMGELDYAELTGGDWLYDEGCTEDEWDDIVTSFKASFTKKFPSFSEEGISEDWISGNSGFRSRRVILESKLFYICLEDNEWSEAIELIQKEEPWGLPWMENLQKRLYQKYLNGIKESLLNRLPSIGTYAGAWTSGVLTKDDIEI